MSELRQAIAHHETRTPVDRVLDAFTIGLAGSRAGRTRTGGGAGARFQVEEVEQRARQHLFGQRSSGVEPVDSAGPGRRVGAAATPRAP
ncbi:MAG: hypothetical protein E6F96_01910 [Actinobacteria bacterium]|nr:MAG: hypothetical protein E6F96_01910 [Actinomycetota bacterium]